MARRAQQHDCTQTEQINEMKQKLDFVLPIQQRVNFNTAEITEIKKNNEAMRRDLYGNGRSGVIDDLKTRMTKIEVRMSAIAVEIGVLIAAVLGYLIKLIFFGG